MMRWQWHQPDNHANTLLLNFLQAVPYLMPPKKQCESSEGNSVIWQSQNIHMLQENRK